MLVLSLSTNCSRYAIECDRKTIVNFKIKFVILETTLIIILFY